MRAVLPGFNVGRACVVGMEGADMKGEFITDLGQPLITRCVETGEIQDCGRYGVWGDKGHWTGKAEVIETGNDLEALKAKYGDLPVYDLPMRGL